MASTFSDLKIELIATGEQSGTWGTTTNTNLGTALEQAITGSGDVSFSSADVTLTLTDTNASQTARNLRLNLTGTSGGARNLIVPAIEKQYIVNNGLADTVTVKNSTGTGVAVPAGKTMVVFNNATDVVDVTNHASSLTLGSALPVASGGTGQTSYTDGQLLIGNTTGNTLAKSTLTAGSGVSITNGSGSITISATGLGGDVVGPASSTDNAVVRFDGTTGKLVQNSNVIIADDGTTVISTNSSTDALRITQTGAGNALVVEDSTNPDSSPFVVDASGNVGIGLTTVPDAFALYNSSAARLAVYGDGQTQIIATRFSTDANAPVVLIGKARGTYLSPTAVATGDTLGQMSFSAYGGSNYRTIATVGAFIDTYTSDTDISSNLRFSTSPSGSASATERMRIRSDGNIGIGGAGGALSRLTLGGTFTDASGNTQGIRVAGTVPSTTTAYVGLTNVLATQAAAFTLSQAVHFSADQVTLGAGSAVNSQIGFNASSTLTGATNNYGFYSNIAAPTSGITTTGTITSISSSGTTVTVNHNAITYTNGQTVTVTATANITDLTSGATCTLLTLGTTTSLPGAASSSVTFADSGDIVTYTAHGMSNGTPIFFSAITSTTGISINTIYYVVNATINAFQVASTVGGSPLALTTDGTGTCVQGVFTATGAGTGTGTVTLRVQGSGKTVAGAASGSFTFTTTTSQTFSAVTVLSGSVTVSTRWNVYVNGTAANYFGGNVGIQTTTTTNKLEIGGSGDSIMRLLAAGQANGLEIGQLTADGGNKVFAANNNYLVFGTNNTERMRINSVGDVFIGTTTNTNSSKLVVNGTISETVGGVQYRVLSQYDVGTSPGQVPLNQNLGTMAYVDQKTYVDAASAKAFFFAGF